MFCSCRSITRPINTVEAPPEPFDHVCITIPFKTLEKNNLFQQSTCPICLDNFEQNTNLAQLCCNHVFHKECISTWLNYKLNCPLCNIELPAPEIPHLKKSNHFAFNSATKAADSMSAGHAWPRSPQANAFGGCHRLPELRSGCRPSWLSGCILRTPVLGRQRFDLL